MQQRFYFDLIDGHATIRDDEGVDADNLGEAVEQARFVIHEMQDSGELTSNVDVWQLVVRNESGTLLATVPLS